MSFFSNLPVFSFFRNGVQTPVSKDTVTPANSRPLPVEITGATGDVAINASNLHLEVQLSHSGANPDSVQIGDGVDTAEVVDGRLQTSATASGLGIAGLVTIVSINSVTWTALPATPLTDRNAMCIINTSGVEIKLNYSSSIVGYVGVPLGVSNQRFYDISDSIVIYAKSSAGTVDVTIEELS